MCPSDPAADDAPKPAARSIHLGSISSTFQEALTRKFGERTNPQVKLRDGAAEGVSEERIEKLRSGAKTTERYIVKDEIGRGGMGAVLKIFDADLRRNLAMKVVLGQDGQAGGATEIAPGQLMRFLEEAQVTGQLDHPGVVPVHELGIDAEGRVYFTMRLVKGQELAKIFDKLQRAEDGWSITRVLGLLLKVCEAMSYAHDKGVVHRDLKPANIMVGRHGEVYVMDWGLARVEGRDDAHDLRLREMDMSVSMLQTDRREASQRELDSPLITMDGSVVGTPFYMPPEQAAGRLEDLGPHSDVYALGAMLYHLLTGRMPYHTPGDRMSPHTILALVLHGPPEPVHKLAPSTPPELEAICEKAMAREPGDRYRNMGELGDDLRAYIENRVVSAYRTGALVEFKKWVQRNRSLALTAAALVVLTVGGSSSAALVLRSKNQEVLEARDQALFAKGEADAAALRESQLRIEAEEAKRASEGVTDFLVDQFQALEPENTHGQPVEVIDLLDRAALSLETELGESPLAAARLRGVLGSAYWSLGHIAKVRPLFEQALADRTRLLGERHEDSLHTMYQLARYEHELGHIDRAQELIVRVVELRSETLGPKSEGTLQAMNELANVLESQTRYAEAEALYSEVLEGRRETLGESDSSTLNSLNDLAMFYQGRSFFEKAEPLFLMGLQKSRESLGELHKDTLTSMLNLGALYCDQERFSEAEPLYLFVLEQRRKVLGDEHPSTLTAVNNLAYLYMESERFHEALPLLEETMQKSRRLLGPEHPDTLVSSNNLAVVYSKLGRFEESEALYTQSLKVRLKLHGSDHPDTWNALNNLALLFDTVGRYEEALELFKQLVEAETKLLGPENAERLDTLNNLAISYFNLGEYEQAESLHLEAWSTQLRVLGADHPDTRYSLECLDELYLDWLPERQDELGPEHPKTLNAMAQTADHHRRQGRLEQATELLQACLDLRLETLGEAHPETLESFQQLASLLAEGGQADQAQALFQECLRLRRALLGEGHAQTLSTLEALVRLQAGEQRWSAVAPQARELVRLTPAQDARAEERGLLLQSIESKLID